MSRRSAKPAGGAGARRRAGAARRPRSAAIALFLVLAGSGLSQEAQSPPEPPRPAAPPQESASGRPQPGQLKKKPGAGERALDWSKVQVYAILGSGMVPEGPYEPLTNQELWALYWKDTFFSSNPYIIPWITVLPEQARGYPAQWMGFEGYAKRVGARWVGYSVERTVSYSLHSLLRTEPRYIPCRCDGFWKRFGHAIKYHYVTVNHHGKRVPNFPRFLGIYAGEYTTHTFYPGRYDAWRATRRGTGALIWGWWLNVLREFRPEIVGAFDAIAGRSGRR